MWAERQRRSPSADLREVKEGWTGSAPAAFLFLWTFGCLWSQNPPNIPRLKPVCVCCGGGGGGGGAGGGALWRNQVCLHVVTQQNHLCVLEAGLMSECVSVLVKRFYSQLKTLWTRLRPCLLLFFFYPAFVGILLRLFAHYCHQQVTGGTACSLMRYTNTMRT